MSGCNADIELIEKIQSLISSGNILEISCGNGADALELLKRGYVVFGTENNQQYADHVNQKINCVKHDTKNKFPFPDNSFDLVYSRLGLHYFSESELQSIFKDISKQTYLPCLRYPCVYRLLFYLFRDCICHYVVVTVIIFELLDMLLPL